MRIAKLLLLCGIGLGVCSATTIVNPTFGPSDPNVIGNPFFFDVQSISVTFGGGFVTVSLSFNYDNGFDNTLAPFAFGAFTLQPADLFFYNPADPNTFLYGVAMSSTRPGSIASFTPGALYGITGTGPNGDGITTENVATALNIPLSSNDANSKLTILMVDNTGVSKAPVLNAGNGISITSGGNGSTVGEITATVKFADVFTGNSAIVLNGKIGVEFASADCGNSFLMGTIPVTTPEPETWAMFGIGTMLLGLGLWRRNRSMAFRAEK
jgi:hypothetical protein